MTEPQPLLPAAPWYTSEVQVRGVIAAAAQLVSIVLRIVGRYTELSVTTDMIDAITADVTQGLAVVFAVLALTKRQSSPVAPLTLTAKGAERLTQLNPPLLDSDPTKIPKEARP
jgi:hypothetical protein